MTASTGADIIYFEQTAEWISANHRVTNDQVPNCLWRQKTPDLTQWESAQPNQVAHAHALLLSNVNTADSHNGFTWLGITRGWGLSAATCCKRNVQLLKWEHATETTLSRLRGKDWKVDHYHHHEFHRCQVTHCSLTVTVSVTATLTLIQCISTDHDHVHMWHSTLGLPDHWGPLGPVVW